MKVAFVSVRFRGHITVLLEKWTENTASHLFVVAFANDCGYEHQGHVRETEIVANQKSPSENAAVFNEARCQLLRDELHVRLYDFMPDVIVYDFFCLEAPYVARRLGIPAVCSVPAMLHPTRSDVCSDALLPDEKLYWVWRHPVPHPIRPSRRVMFLGPRTVSHTTTTLPAVPPGAFFVYCTLGTVVPHYESLRAKRDAFVDALVDAAHQAGVFVLASIPGLAHRSSDHIVFVDDCDQLHVLRDLRPHLFLFHGGGNSYSEALAHQVPCLVYPFFGDQFETARVAGPPLELSELRGYLDQTKKVPPPPPRAHGALLHVPFSDNFSNYFQEGDLVFGHSRHRDALQAQFASIDLHLNHFCSFLHISTSGLPAIADVYNDETVQEVTSTAHATYGLRLQQFRHYRDHLEGKLTNMVPEHKLVHYCLLLAKLTVTVWSGRIHFLLDCEAEMGPATKIEYDAICENVRESSVWRNNVIFYRFGRRVPAPLSWPRKTWSDHATLDACQAPPFELHGGGRMPFWSGRRKSPASCDEKVQCRGLPVRDLVAFRTGYLDRADLRTLMQRADRTATQAQVTVYVGRVVYLYFENSVEVQLWPWTYLHHFYLDMHGQRTDRARQVQMQDAIDQVAARHHVDGVDEKVKDP